MGEFPLWARLIRAGRFLGVPPWDLASAPAFWLDAAEELQAAEAAAERQKGNKGPQGSH